MCTEGVDRSVHAFSWAVAGCDAGVACCAGALLAVGVLNCGVQHENDPAYALLYEFVEKPDATIRIGAIMGLGLAYAGVPGSDMLARGFKCACLAVSAGFALLPGNRLLSRYCAI